MHIHTPTHTKDKKLTKKENEEEKINWTPLFSHATKVTLIGQLQRAGIKP